MFGGKFPENRPFHQRLFVAQCLFRSTGRRSKSNPHLNRRSTNSAPRTRAKHVEKIANPRVRLFASGWFNLKASLLKINTTNGGGKEIRAHAPPRSRAAKQKFGPMMVPRIRCRKAQWRKR